MLEARGISFRYGPRDPLIVQGFDLSVAPGEGRPSGPSGRGKSTIGRLLARHLRPTAGLVTRMAPSAGARLQPGAAPVAEPDFRRQSALDGGEDRRRGVDARRRQRARPRRAAGLVPPATRTSSPAWQSQRITILRALAPGLRYLVADEITSMLDPLAQAEMAAALAVVKQRAIGLSPSATTRICWGGWLTGVVVV